MKPARVWEYLTSIWVWEKHFPTPGTKCYLAYISHIHHQSRVMQVFSGKYTTTNILLQPQVQRCGKARVQSGTQPQSCSRSHRPDLVVVASIFPWRLPVPQVWRSGPPSDGTTLLLNQSCDHTSSVTILIEPTSYIRPGDLSSKPILIFRYYL